MGTPSDEKSVEFTKDTSQKADGATEKDGKKPIEDGELYEDGMGSDKEKGDEEDIPDDFFDDFSNQDFMDGLDIVDAWDETEKTKKLKERKDKDEKRRQRKRTREREIYEIKSRSNDRDQRRRSIERRRRSRERRHREASPPRRRIPDEGELRRDPSKTKRDLEKDRENYVKKKEQKLISQVVETGLVPPGMETEVNLSDIQNKEKDEKVKEKPKGRGRSKSDDTKLSKEQESRDKSRERRRRRSRSFNRNSPFFRGRSRGWSGERRRERSRDRSRGRRDRSRERLRRTRSRDRSGGRMPVMVSPFSPPHRRRRSRSLSDRERWLMQRRSPSPERKYREMMGEEKLSFMEELKMKLDGFPNNHSPAVYPYPPNSTQSGYMQPTPNVFPDPSVPLGAPAPNQFFPPAPNSPYDQNFFIGDPQPTHNPLNGPQQFAGPPGPVQHMAMGPGSANVGPHPGGVLGPPGSVLQLGDFGNSMRHPVGPVPPPNLAHVPPVSTIGMKSVAQLMEQIRATTNTKLSQTASQLLEEKKLSLTDFLSINTRPAAFSSNPEALQKKVNVLSRCQDVLKELTGDKKFGGKLLVLQTNKNQSDQHAKNVSPLLRKERVKLAYTTHTKKEKSSFQGILNRALVKAGLIPEVIEIDDDPSTVEVTLPPPPKIGKQKNPPFGSGIKQGENKSPKGVLMKMCQTDPMQCDDCERRKAVQYCSIGIQCGESERYNVGVQVVEADIINSKIPKNQSLAYLTPAQLLGRGEPTSTKVDNFATSYGRPSQPYRDYPEFRERQRGYDDDELRRLDYPYSGSAMRDPRLSRY